ncbi:MAG: hypothetical protein Q9P90_12590 [candidate division KSB1 bacterium]|nr:hypothetical protein [candidate division KSB1 bacterium]
MNRTFMRPKPFLSKRSFIKSTKLAIATAVFFLSGSLLVPAGWTQRLLMIDKNMMPWQTLVEHARPWIEAGCRVEYRQYAPFLLRRDLDIYDLIWIRGGRMPLFSSAFLSREDVDLLKTFVQQGKAVILVYPIHRNEAGAYDRRAINQFLREIQANIQIGSVPLTDSLHQYLTLTGHGQYGVPAPGLALSEKQRVAIGRAAPLKILKDARAEVLAFSFPGAFFRKKKIAYRASYPLMAVVLAGSAPILILPEPATQVQAQGDDASFYPILQPAAADTSRRFTAAVARRFLQIARNPDALKITPSPIFSAIPTHAQAELWSFAANTAVTRRKPYPVKTTALSREHLLDAEMIALRESVYLDRLRAAGFFRRFFKHGLRILVQNPGPPPKTPAAKATGAAAEQLLAFLQQAGLSFCVSHVQMKGQPERLASNWKSLLQATGRTRMRALWLPGFSLDALPEDRPPALGIRGQSAAIPTPFDRRFWWKDLISPAIRLAGALYRFQPFSPGLALDVDFYRRNAPPHFNMGHDFSEAAFIFFLAANRGLLSEQEIRRAQALPPQNRFAFLAQNGWLPLYYATLEAEIEKMARTLRREVEAVAPNRVWVVQSRGLPNQWFLRGLLRGLSQPDQPVILLSHEPMVQPYLTWLQKEDIYLLHGLAIYPARYRKNELSALLKLARTHHHGYWLAMASGFFSRDRIPLPDGERSLADFARLLKRSASK